MRQIGRYFYLYSLLFLISSGTVWAQEEEEKTLSGMSWDEVKVAKQGILSVMHYDRRPFVYTSEGGQFTGIEHDVVQEIIRYAQKKYDVQVFPQWVEFKDYSSFHKALKEADNPGVIGLSSVRLENEETDDKVVFSAPFMKGTEILVTGSNLPVADTKGQLKAVLKGRKAVTVKNSTFEQHLNEIKDDYFPDAEYIYVDTHEEIAEMIAKSPDYFAYVALPDYYVQLKDGKEMNRQPHFSVEHKGYALSMPVGSSWEPLIKEFFDSEGFKPTMNFLIKRHLGTDVKEILWEGDKKEPEGDSYGEVKEEDAANLRVKLDAETGFSQALMVYSSIITLVFLLTVFVWRRSSKTKKVVIAETEEKLDSQKDRLASLELKAKKAIEFGIYTQSASLHKRKPISDVFTDSFRIFTPRDQISGDMYWFRDEGAHKIIVAIDSSGQNVAGTFVTVQCNILLDQIVKEDRITDPSEIIKELDRRLYDRVMYDGTDFIHKDGLDISVCLIDTENRKILFAGAKQAVYHVSGGRLHQMKGGKYSLGTPSFRPEEIENQTTDYSPGEVLYLCTDGFQNQLDRNNKNKFLVKRFREFLFEMHDQPLKAQKSRLEEEFDRWKGGNKQTDDILIIGLRLI